MSYFPASLGAPPDRSTDFQIQTDAGRLVTALSRAQSDPSFMDSAQAILAERTGDDRDRVANKAISMGADAGKVFELLNRIKASESIIDVVSAEVSDWFTKLRATFSGASATTPPSTMVAPPPNSQSSGFPIKTVAIVAGVGLAGIFAWKKWGRR